jgi:hypothetical protein
MSSIAGAHVPKSLTSNIESLITFDIFSDSQDISIVAAGDFFEITEVNGPAKRVKDVLLRLSLTSDKF